MSKGWPGPRASRPSSPAARAWSMASRSRCGGQRVLAPQVDPPRCRLRWPARRSSAPRSGRTDRGRSSTRSLKVPGSDSSQFATTCFVASGRSATARHLPAGGEGRPAPAGESRVGDRPDDGVGSQVQGSFQGAIPAVLAVRVQAGGVDHPHPGQQAKVGVAGLRKGERFGVGRDVVGLADALDEPRRCPLALAQARASVDPVAGPRRARRPARRRRRSGRPRPSRRDGSGRRSPGVRSGRARRRWRRRRPRPAGPGAGPPRSSGLRG